MPRRNRSLDRLIDRTTIALTNARTPDLQAVLAPVGYDPTKLDEGDALLATLEAAYSAQQGEYGGGIGATATVHGSQSAAEATYMRHLGFARVAFEDDPERQEALGLTGRRERARDAWTTQALHFYDNLTPDDITTLGTYGVAPEDLTAARDAVETVQAAASDQTDEKGQAQEATAARDASAIALRKWMRAFNRVATLATEGHPQLRERLGIRER
jgi:hypothetical protein